MKEFSHLDKEGNINMVDVSGKNKQLRKAIASGFISMKEETIKKIKLNEIAKGNVMAVAKVAAIGAGKKTSEIIPLCHNIFISSINVDFTIKKSRIDCLSTATATDCTGVEMEALTAVSIALLTVYDMCKAVDKNMVISQIKLLEKSKQNLV